MAKPAARRTAPPRKPMPPQPEMVDPRWLLRTLGVLIVLALVCGYLTLGLLFYLGSWQLALKPTHNASDSIGLPSQPVTFSSGGEQVHGQWLPAAADSTRSSYAVLYLRNGGGQLDAADGTQMQMLHNHGLAVLAFDYRGYGPNAPRPHPTEKRMLQDADAAWEYLQRKQGITANHVLVFGSGVGVSLGAQLLTQQHAGAALIGYDADPDVLARVKQDPRSHLFPLGLVFHDRFRLDALRELRVPKLLYSSAPLDAARRKVFETAADPKLTVEVHSHSATEEDAALSRFLDAYISAGPTLLPIPPAKPQ